MPRPTARPPPRQTTRQSQPPPLFSTRVRRPRPSPSRLTPTASVTGTITLTAVQDTLDEVDETIVVDISTVLNGTESGTQQVTAIITDDDPPPTVAFNAAASSGSESVTAVSVPLSLSTA